MMTLWQKIGLGLLLIGSLVGSGYFVSTFRGSQEVHYHAGFQMYDKGELLDFSGPEFMYLGECGAMGHSFETVRDRIHLHERIGDVAHIHDDGVTWRNLFESLNREDLIKNLDWVIVEGSVVDDEEVLDRVIDSYERVVFVTNQSEIDAAKLWEGMISEEYIREVEEASLNCNPV